MNAKTIEQLKEEARLAAEAVAQAEQAAREAQREQERAEREAREQARLAKERAAAAEALGPVQAALIAAGDPNVASVDLTDHGTLRVVGPMGRWSQRETIVISREAEMHRSSSWRSRPTGRYVLRLSGCGERDVRYPPRKAGGYGVDKIAAEVRERFEGAAARNVRERDATTAKQRAEALAAEVKARCGASRMSVTGTVGHSYPKARGYEYHEAVASRGKVFCAVGTLELTPEQAVALDAALASIIPAKKEV